MKMPLDPGIKDDGPMRLHIYGRDVHADRVHERPHVLDAIASLGDEDATPAWTALQAMLAGALALIMLLLFTHDALAAGPLPPIGRPLQTVPFACTRPYLCVDFASGLGAVTWYCDARRDATDPRGYVQTGQWWRYGYADATLRTLPSSAAQALVGQYYAVHALLTGETDAQLTTRWHTAFDNTLPLEDPSSPDYAAYPLYLSCGDHLGYPPSGLRTHVEKPLAYKQSPLLPGWKWTVIGTVPAGVPCNSQNRIDSADGTIAYFQIDRTKVVMRSRFEPLPTTAFAECL